jgi:hypothetical protein
MAPGACDGAAQITAMISATMGGTKYEPKDYNRFRSGNRPAKKLSPKASMKHLDAMFGAE